LNQTKIILEEGEITIEVVYDSAQKKPLVSLNARNNAGFGVLIRLTDEGARAVADALYVAAMEAQK